MISVFGVNIRSDDRSLSLWRSLTFDVVNDAGDVDRAIQRVIATARATGGAAGTAEGFPFYHRRGPQNLDIAVRAARWLAHAAIKLFLMITHLSLRLGVFHDRSFSIPIFNPQTGESAFQPSACGVLAFSLPLILPQALLEKHRRIVRDVLELSIFRRG